MAAVFAAARSEDGRGQKTVLEQIVPEHFGLRTPTELAEAVHRGDVDLAAEMISEEADVRNAASVTPLVLGAAPSDPVAAEIVERLADEIVALVRVALTRLSLLGESVEVLLGGGLFLSGSEILFREVEARLAGVAPLARPQVSDSPPIVGAALLGLDEVGSDAEAQLRVRRELGDAFDRIGGRGKHRVQGRPGTSRAETTSDTAGRRE